MNPPGLSFLAGGGEVGALMRSADWGATPLGPAAAWPAALRTVVGLMLASNQPMYIAWGPQRSFLYNDHYAPFLGDKHPAALGRDLLSEVWPEIRGQLEPLVEATRIGEPVQVPRMELALNRHGRLEETHFSFFFAIQQVVVVLHAYEAGPTAPLRQGKALCEFPGGHRTGCLHTSGAA